MLSQLKILVRPAHPNPYPNPYPNPGPDPDPRCKRLLYPQA